MKTLKRAQPAAAMPDEIEGLRAHVALLKAALAQAERENDELRVRSAAATAAPSDDCDDVDAILRIVGLDPERCRTEGGALNVGRVRTLWEDVVSLAAQASGQAAPSDEEIFEVARAAGLDHGVIQDDAYRSALGIPRGTRYILMDVKPGQTLAFARALLSRHGQAPAASAEPWKPLWDEIMSVAESEGTPTAARMKEWAWQLRRLAAPVAAQARAAGSPRDWTEDAGHENGNYQCKCTDCGQTFMGHKRRVVCKVCAQAPAANGDAPTARELDMAMLIKRLAATLRVAWPESTYMKAADDAMDALNRWGLAGSPLREGGE